MLTPAEALGLILMNVRPLGGTYLPLERALGHCLSEDIRADRDIPPADRSAMDGYAVRSSDVSAAPCVLRLKGEVPAGAPARSTVTPGTCIRVLTGANIPRGADAVVMVEQTTETEGLVSMRTAVEPGENVLRRGEDAKRAAVLLPRGTILGSAQIGVCAAVGKGRVRVHKRPRVAVVCTGRELRGIGDAVTSYQQRNSNGPALRAALSQWKYRAVPFTSAPDDVNKIASAINRLLPRCEVILVTGGVSVGKYDFVREAVERVGGKIIFHGVAMKPGKPVLYAALRGNRRVFGLPGPPLSAMTTFHEFALPALRRMSGVEARDCRPSMYVRLASPLSSKGGRVRYLLGRLLWEKDGTFVEPVHSHSSADLAAGGKADGVIAVPADVRNIDAGGLVELHPWRPLP